MKYIDCNFDELFEKIDSFKNDKNIQVIYYDILPKELTKYKNFLQKPKGTDSFYTVKDSNMIFFARKVYIKTYKDFMKSLFKFSSCISLVNRIIPVSVIDYNNNITYNIPDELVYKEIEDDDSIEN